MEGTHNLHSKMEKKINLTQKEKNYIYDIFNDSEEDIIYIDDEDKENILIEQKQKIENSCYKLKEHKIAEELQDEEINESKSIKFNIDENNDSSIKESNSGQVQVYEFDQENSISNNILNNISNNNLKIENENLKSDRSKFFENDENSSDFFTIENKANHIQRSTSPSNRNDDSLISNTQKEERKKEIKIVIENNGIVSDVDNYSINISEEDFSKIENERNIKENNIKKKKSKIKHKKNDKKKISLGQKRLKATSEKKNHKKNTIKNKINKKNEINKNENKSYYHKNNDFTINKGMNDCEGLLESIIKNKMGSLTKNKSKVKKINKKIKSSCIKKKINKLIDEETQTQIKKDKIKNISQNSIANNLNGYGIIKYQNKNENQLKNVNIINDISTYINNSNIINNSTIINKSKRNIKDRSMSDYSNNSNSDSNMNLSISNDKKINCNSIISNNKPLKNKLFNNNKSTKNNDSFHNHDSFNNNELISNNESINNSSSINNDNSFMNKSLTYNKHNQNNDSFQINYNANNSFENNNNINNNSFDNFSTHTVPSKKSKLYYILKNIISQNSYESIIHKIASKEIIPNNNINKYLIDILQKYGHCNVISSLLDLGKIRQKNYVENSQYHSLFSSNTEKNIYLKGTVNNINQIYAKTDENQSNTLFYCNEKGCVIRYYCFNGITDNLIKCQCCENGCMGSGILKLSDKTFKIVKNHNIEEILHKSNIEEKDYVYRKIKFRNYEKVFVKKNQYNNHFKIVWKVH